MDHRSHQLWESPHNLAECYSDLQQPHPKWSVWTSSLWILLNSAYLSLQNWVGHEPITMAIHKHPDKLACKGLAWATILTTHSETRRGSWSDTWISSDQPWHRIPQEEWASPDSWIFERSCGFSIQLPCLRKMILLTYDQTGGVPVGERLGSITVNSNHSVLDGGRVWAGRQAGNYWWIIDGYQVLAPQCF